MWYSGHNNRASRAPASSTVTRASIVYTSTSVSEMPPAPPASAVTAAQVATQMPGAYPPRPAPTRSTTNTDQQRALPPPPLDRPPTGTAVTTNDPHSTHDHFDGRNGDADPYGDQHSCGNETQGGSNFGNRHPRSVIAHTVRSTSSVRRSRSKRRKTERWTSIRRG